MNSVDAETWRAMAGQARAAGLPITRRSEGGLSGVFVGTKAAWVEVRSLDEVVAACGLSGAARCTERYGDT